MPMLYGEGDTAFIRLQEEIIKVSNDQSILAWKPMQNGVLLAVLAESPIFFKECSHSYSQRIEAHNLYQLTKEYKLSCLILSNNS